jgi:superkiller protein 3
LQLSDALSLYLPDSPLYSTLSTLPVPDFTNPTSTTTFPSQVAIHNSLPTLEEIVSVTEADEKKTFDSEVAKRRTRLNAGSLRDVENEVTREVYGGSKVLSLVLIKYSLTTVSYPICTTKFSTTQIHPMSFAG